MGLLYALLIGAAAGWLAGKIMKGGGFGALINIILGIVGGLVGNWYFGHPCRFWHCRGSDYRSNRCNRSAFCRWTL